MFLILQWNARSLIANGQELKRFVDTFKEKPKVICVQETWLKGCLDFVIPGYICLRKDRKSTGGGCATFIEQGVQYRRIDIKIDIECVAVEIWSTQGRISVINFYNPCIQLDSDKLDQIMEKVRSPVVWVGDFNSHNPLWGSVKRDLNGTVLEDFLDKYRLVMLNDGRPTRFNMTNKRTSCIDVTFASAELAKCGEWDVLSGDNMGSDHFPILSKFGRALHIEPELLSRGYNFQRADWEKFGRCLSERLEEIDSEHSTDEWSQSFCDAVRKAAGEAIPVKGKKSKRKIVPWWNQTCSNAVRVRNRAYQSLKKYPTDSHVIEYKRRRAEARRVIKQAKKESWQKYCGTLGAQTPVGKMWGMIRRMAGINRGLSMPVLTEGDTEAISNGEKAELLGKTFQQVHSKNNISREGLARRNATLGKEGHKLKHNNDNIDPINLFFSMKELKSAIRRGRHTAPGRDGLGYEFYQHMDESVLLELLTLINAVWEEGHLPEDWKHAVVVPILKPGKEAESPLSYRPIALTEVMCKIMERMVTDRLVYRLERKGYFSSAQNGFRIGRSTMDSVLVLDHDIKKALVNREVVLTVFLDIEKAYDMLWREGLVIKLYNAGIRGRMLNWIKQFLSSRSIQVKVGGCFSGIFKVDNGTPQGSVISPVLFNIMINDMFDGVDGGFGRALFADDGALWKRGRNIKFLFKQMQSALSQVQNWEDR